MEYRTNKSLGELYPKQSPVCTAEHKMPDKECKMYSRKKESCEWLCASPREKGEIWEPNDYIIKQKSLFSDNLGFWGILIGVLVVVAVGAILHIKKSKQR